MPITTVPVTCRAFDQNGNAVRGAIYKATLNRVDSQPNVSDGLIVPEIVTATSDANGVAVLNLWPNVLGSAGSAYKVQATNPDTRRRFVDGYIVVPNAACELDAILTLTAPSPNPTPTPPPTGGGGGTGTGTSLTITAQTPLVVDNATAGTAALSVLPATGTRDGTMSAADKFKLDTIDAEATKNATDEFLRDRANHTGQIAVSVISNFSQAVSAVPGFGGNSGAGSKTPATLTYAPEIEINAAAFSSFRVTLNGDALFKAPTNLADGEILQLAIKQGSGGGKNSTFDPAYQFGTYGTFTNSRMEGAIDFLQFWNSGTDGLFLISISQGLTSTVIAPPTSVPIPLNNQIAFIGDGRFWLNSIMEAVTPFDAAVHGPAIWAMQASNYRGRFVGNYGMIGNGPADVQRRLTATEMRGQILSSPASIFVLLVGAQTDAAIGVTGPIYADIIAQLTANNKIVILLNELPDSNELGRGAANVARRDYINATTFSGGNRVVKFDSYTLMNEPGGFEFKPGLGFTNSINPSIKGARVLGTAIGEVLEPILAAGGFAPRTALPTATNDAAFLAAPMWNGTTGTRGTGATGQMAAGWSGEPIPSGLTVVYSKGVDPDGYEQQICTISGTTGSAGTLQSWNIYNYGVGAAGTLSGDQVSHLCRVQIDAGNQNLVAAIVRTNAGDNSNNIYQNCSSFNTNIYDNNNANRGTLDGEAFAGVVISQPCTLHAGWTAAATKTITPGVGFIFLGGVPVSATIRFSRSGVIRTTTVTTAPPATDTFMSKSGTNLSGMEWARPGLRYGRSTTPNINYTVPRDADVQYIKNSGYGKIRLPIQWELLQPVLHDANPNAATRAIVGQPGAFNAAYQQYITNVFDACAEAGVKCLLDLHNYCRYQDFIYEPDGSINGLTVDANPLVPPFTVNNTKVRVKIFALAAGATLTQANFNDFWVRAANLWRNHPGFGGYGLMNEPNTMPGAGNIVQVYDPASTNNTQDYSIWTTYAISAYNAIRAVDPTGLIYVGGNDWSNAMQFGTINPGFPIPGATNVLYDVHAYLDASSGGFRFDWDYEVALGYSAGLSGPINENTGRDRLQRMVNWATAQVPPVKVSLTEIGMPIDDIRWQRSMKNAMDLCKAQDWEVFTWMGGNHAFIHDYAINHVPQFHQNKTMEPLVSGPIKAAAGVNSFQLFVDGDSYNLAGTPCAITVHARGNLASPVTVNVSTTGAGSLSKAVLTIPAGANTSDTFTYTPVANQTAVISFTSIAPVPPNHRVYSYVDPVARASTDLADGALAIMAKYKVSKWAVEDAYTDYMQGVPCIVGNQARAIADSGFGSKVGSPQEMLNWFNTDNGALGSFSMPAVAEAGGKRYLNLGAYGTTGLWNKKTAPQGNGVRPNPTGRPLYDLADPHFAIGVVQIPSTAGNGVVFQAGLVEGNQRSEILIEGGIPRARWADSGTSSVTRSGTALALNTPHVLSLHSTGGTQSLRVNTAVAATGSNALPPNTFNQMLMGWGYVNYFPRDGFMGRLYGCAAGRGNPTNAELVVMERYMGTLAGLAL